MRLTVYVFISMTFFTVSFASAACDGDLPNSTGHLVLNDVKGVVTDSKTKLMWKRCPQGFTNVTCTTESATTYTWNNALNLPADANLGAGFAGYTNWRLPNVKELQSIVEEQCSSPAINSVFTGTPSSAIFWSNSPSAALTDLGCEANQCAWAVYFNDENLGATDGYILPDLFGMLHYVRLVRDCTGTECD